MAIITLSRGTLSGGKMIAEMLAEKLNYKSVSREVVVKAAEKYSVPEYKLFEAIQKSPSFVQRLTFEREKYLATIQAALCEFVKDDNVVYHGHAGHLLLKGVSHVLRIRALAPMEFRIREAKKRQNLSESEAIKYIHKVDKQRVKWTKFLYGVDWRSPELYDMVFNLENASLEFVSNIIQYAISQDAFKTTPESRKSVHDFLLSSQVKAAIATTPDIKWLDFEVVADDGSITIVGESKSEAVIKEILEIAAKVPGVKDVKSKLRLNYRYQTIDT